MDAPHVYISLPSLKIGRNSETKIVSAESIAKFSYAKYKKNQNVYKDKVLELHPGPCGEKMACCVLFAGG